MEKTRSYKATINIKYALMGQLLAYVLNYVSRIIFVQILSSEYLGISGLFTNIIKVLSLSELGIGTAISFHLYKPIIEEDNEKINELMRIYSYAYITIGFTIFIIGISLTPFLDYLMKERPKIDNSIELIYILYIIQTSSSYFLSYKKSFLYAKQEGYIVNIVHYGIEVIALIISTVFLIITKNYIVYLIVSVLFKVLDNLICSIICNIKYPYLKHNHQRVQRETLKSVSKDVFALSVHQVGNVAVNGTDNIIISKIIGVANVGYYSNYSLVVGSISSIVGQVFKSVTASIGDLNANNDEEHKYNRFKDLLFVSYWIYTYCAVCFGALIQDFIYISFGSEYVLDNVTVLCIITVFFLNGVRTVLLQFKSTMGIFRQDILKPLAEAIVNLIVSVILAKTWGLKGVFVGTIISSLTTSFWVDPLVLYKYGFRRKVIDYYIIIAKYYAYTIIVFIANYAITSFIEISGIFSIFIKLIITSLFTNILLYIIYRKNKEFKFVKESLNRLLRRTSVK